MALGGLNTPPSVVSLATTTLNSLANNGTVDTAIDLNDYRSGGVGSGVWPYALSIGLLLASLTPSSPTGIFAYWLPSLDGTAGNYADEADQHIMASWLPSTAAAAKYLRQANANILVGDGRYVRLRIKNQLGVSLAASGNILYGHFRHDESV